MAQWPRLPRRLLLLVLAGLLVLLYALYALLPVYGQWQQELAQTASLQQRFSRAAQQVGKNPAQSDFIEVVSGAELSIWMADLAILAEQKGLQWVHINPVALAHDAKKHNVNSLVLQAEGSFLALLQWWQTISTSPRVLAMEEVELTGLDNQRVRGKIRVLFEQKDKP
ncbi:MAG: hypothetical protein ACRCV6_06200 [Formosimonas sp.]